MKTYTIYHSPSNFIFNVFYIRKWCPPPTCENICSFVIDKSKIKYPADWKYDDLAHSEIIKCRNNKMQNLKVAVATLFHILRYAYDNVIVVKVMRRKKLHKDITELKNVELKLISQV